MVNAARPQDDPKVAARKSADAALCHDHIARLRSDDGIGLRVYQPRDTPTLSKGRKTLIIGADLRKSLAEADDNIDDGYGRRAGRVDGLLEGVHQRRAKSAVQHMHGSGLDVH